MKRWHVIYTRPRSESLALQHLERQGFTAYLPRHRKQRRHARRTDWISAPLFPRYMFVLLDVAAARWRAIRSTIGVNNIICQGDRPLPMLPGVVEELIERENEDGFVCAAPDLNLRKGQGSRRKGIPVRSGGAVRGHSRQGPGGHPAQPAGPPGAGPGAGRRRLRLHLKARYA